MTKKTLRLSRQLKALRKAKGLTLDQLAKSSGVSKAMLSQIEQSKVNPTVAIMLKIADALQFSLADLIEKPKRKSFLRNIPADDKHYTYQASKSCVIRTLSPLRLEKNIEFYWITLEGGCKLASEPHYPGTEEFLHLARGKLAVTSDQESTALNKGDSIHYRADVPHVLKNTGKSRVEAYLVVWYKS
jgi:transcriptional regulator with XRE-family HTH domain